MWQGSWAGSAVFHIEVECCYTVALSAWCSAHQLLGSECTGKSLPTPFGCIYAIYMGIYDHI